LNTLALAHRDRRYQSVLPAGAAFVQMCDACNALDQLIHEAPAPLSATT
jgi:hypothetical protein